MRRRRWTDQQFIDRFGILVTVGTAVLILILVIMTRCNS
jgi:hypothetical protein